MVQNHPTIYIVPTPIGNLEDFSPHAKEILTKVSFIICEDTRHSRKLLQHFSIKNHLESLHLHNEMEKISYLIDKILASSTLSAALISDAGTPCISDPGALFIQRAHELNIQVISLPGPSSMACSLAASGFTNKRFLFSGFLERSLTEQENEFEVWKNASPCSTIIFESPRRLISTLENIQNYFGNTLELCVSKEISKFFESHKKGKIEKIISFFKEHEPQGEFVITLNIENVENIEDKDFTQALKKVTLLKEQGASLKEAVKEVAKLFKMNTKELYKHMLSNKTEQTNEENSHSK
ncbi:MAG: 16S rRNA (cytidine(1402)-2'-O)-methyltransferase [Silvanigrellaceae bacterium]|nr:16S rRNA (cytidine(1402)-2'-O)-methyltransferase [Silvanigrellaceae bacterium]